MRRGVGHPRAGPPSDRSGDAESAIQPTPLSPIERERIIRGIPRWYAVTLKTPALGRPAPLPARNVSPSADAWTATPEQVADHQIGSPRAGQVRLRLTGNDAALRPMLVALEKRPFRDGG